jgi:mycoredoxin
MQDNTPLPESDKDLNIDVVVFGTRWCASTQYVRRFLDRHNVTHTYRDLDRDPEAADQVRWWTGGYLSHPTVKIGGDILVEPLSNEIRTSLEKNKII